MDCAVVPGMNREERLNQWIETYSDAILRTCFLYLSDQAQAEDALQDTWIKAWKHMSEYENQGIQNEKAWLMRIAINTTIIGKANRHKSDKNRPRNTCWRRLRIY